MPITFITDFDRTITHEQGNCHDEKHIIETNIRVPEKLKAMIKNIQEKGDYFAIASFATQDTIGIYLETLFKEEDIPKYSRNTLFYPSMEKIKSVDEDFKLGKNACIDDICRRFNIHINARCKAESKTGKNLHIEAICDHFKTSRDFCILFDDEHENVINAIKIGVFAIHIDKTDTWIAILNTILKFYEGKEEQKEGLHAYIYRKHFNLNTLAEMINPLRAWIITNMLGIILKKEDTCIQKLKWFFQFETEISEQISSQILIACLSSIKGLGELTKEQTERAVKVIDFLLETEKFNHCLQSEAVKEAMEGIKQTLEIDATRQYRSQYRMV